MKLKNTDFARERDVGIKTNASTKLILFMLVMASNVHSDVIFKNGFASIIQKVNDTGITWSGNSSTGNNIDCSASDISSPQDCDQGRDQTNNDDTDGHAGFSFTKLDVAGNPLDSSALQWSCVRDNHTGLTWEVKTTEQGIHNKNNIYSWGGLTAVGFGHPDAMGSYSSDWDDLIQGSNNTIFCGHNDWRVPTLSEFFSILDIGKTPTIDINFFPNTVADLYWTASPDAFNSDFAWYMGFEYGFSYKKQRQFGFRVRLVRKDL